MNEPHSLPILQAARVLHVPVEIKQINYAVLERNGNSSIIPRCSPLPEHLSSGQTNNFHPAVDANPYRCCSTEYRAVVSIQMFALNCKTMLPYVEQIRQMMPKVYVEKLLQENKEFKGNGKYVPYDLSYDNFLMMVDGIGDLKELSQPGSVYLFKLTGAKSPFNQTSKLAQITGFQPLSFNNKDGHTTDAFQFIMLFRNSEAAAPLE